MQAGHDLTLLERLVDISLRQVEAAGEGDWERLGRLLAQRAPLADAVASLASAHPDAPTRAALWAKLALAMALDQHVHDLALAARNTLNGELRQLNVARRGLTAYAVPPSMEAARYVNHSR